MRRGRSYFPSPTAIHCVNRMRVKTVEKSCITARSSIWFAGSEAKPRKESRKDSDGSHVRLPARRRTADRTLRVLLLPQARRELAEGKSAMARRRTDVRVACARNRMRVFHTCASRPQLLGPKVR